MVEGVKFVQDKSARVLGRASPDRPCGDSSRVRA
jgi:hypothetical protein